MISSMDDKRLKVVNALQGIFGSQWQNVAPSKSLGQKLADQQLRISIFYVSESTFALSKTLLRNKKIDMGL